ncbi:C40 family peptidase [Anaeromicropila populeti]|uniref:Uncharacterized protein n=1 Tax=Anaeromicropila populeti TaxID=37658 RepID=A0A1I6JVV2_9FIRM|nr:hypothetical protein [Anaeromicropila populeti]SFR83066.1 hypothetical protein SAMN05661086_01990 [Anaeromicropila populeti]
MSQLEQISKATVKISDLKKGDIILLSPYDQWDSKLIAIVTNSPVSHGVMSYYDYNTIVEENPPCVQTLPIAGKIKGRDAYVVRNKKETLDMEPVVKIAEKYLNQKDPFTYVSVYTIAIYMLMSEVNLTKELQQQLIIFFKAASIEVEKYLKEQKDSDCQPMTCSQFIYECYNETGEEYKVDLVKTALDTSLLSRVKKVIESNPEKYQEMEVNLEIDEKFSAEEEIMKLMEETFHSFESGSINDVNDEVITDDFAVAFSKFCILFLKTQKIVLGDKDYIKALDILINNKEFYVTPGDLLVNTSNFVCLGLLEKIEE